MALDALTRDLLAQFSQVCGERISEITVALLNNKEGTADADQFQRALSQLHTLKGEAGMLDIAEISALAHILEARIKKIQQLGKWDLPIESVLTALDLMQAIAEAKAAQKLVDQETVQQIVHTLKEPTANAVAQTEKLETVRLPPSSLPQPEVTTGVAAADTPVQQQTQAEPTAKAASSPAEAMPQAPVSLQQEARPEMGLSQLEPEKMAAIAKRAATATERITPEMVDSGFANKKNEVTKRLETITRKRLATGNLPIEIRKLENLNAQVEKVVTCLIFFNNMWKNFQTTGNRLREVFSCAGHLLDQMGNIPPALEKKVRDMSRQLQHVLQQYERFQEQSAHLMLDMESANEELILQNLEFRLMPVSILVQHFQRGVYEMAKVVGKEVKLETKGLETALDRGILEKFSEPVVHILRNAIDHGIESPEQREAAGKSRHGTILFQAQTKGREVEIVIADDGRGIDLDAVVAKALQKGILQPQEAATLSERDKMEIIFQPNFSTRSEANQFSGRGIGMDIVKRAVDMMDGKITIHSQKGRGTSFVIQLPITLAKLFALIVRVGNISVCIPTYCVEEVMYATARDIRVVGGVKAVCHRGENIPLLWLHRKLGIACEEDTAGESNKLAVVILRMHNKNCVAFVVDKLLGEREVILKPFNRFLKKYRLFSAATLLDEGQLAYLLNIGKLSQGAAAVVPALAVKKKKKVLLVEDSPIVREMEKTILESHGCEVVEATNGNLAVEILQKMQPDLLITDIEMPVMDGLELTRYVRRQHPHRFPVIIVSTRGSERDKAAGLEAGADAYLCKGEFHNNTFIDTVQKWL